MLLDSAIFGLTLLAAIALFSPWLRRNRTWRATITPLASIIGSGFLVLGPILEHSYGQYAPFWMLALCLAAFGFGSAVRYNIAVIGTGGHHAHPLADRLEGIASWALGGAYVVSVAYYLNLFGEFGVSQLPFDSRLAARVLTTAVYALILLAGWTKGFKSLERMEYLSVSGKLAIIAGLLLGLAFFFGDHVAAGDLIFNSPNLTGWGAITLAFGLVITVQGFETSRYLTKEYDPKTCIRSMLTAQATATVIYVIYIALIAYVFKRGEVPLSETGIIDMMDQVAPILPYLLIAAALAAQFSAAVADTSGAGGLFQQASHDRLPPRVGYAALTVFGLALTWGADVFSIINYASRAFAAYYAIQCAIAALNAWQRKSVSRLILYVGLTILGLAVLIFGQAVDA